MLKALLFILISPLAALLHWASDPADTDTADDDDPPATEAVVPAKLTTHANDSTPSQKVRTTLNFVAHQDDDLLFMNPDIASDMQAGDRVWVVYLTAGEVPPGNYEYAKKRVEGEYAAYARAAHVPNRWTQETIYYGGHELSSSTLNGTRVRLVFTYIHAADSFHGEPYGDLWRMRHDETFEAFPLDGRASYTHDELVDTLREMIYAVNPDLIRTQNTQFEPKDHVDHTSAAIFAAEADTIDGATMIERSEYFDYQIGDFKENYTGYWVREKTAIWHTYMRYDREVGPGAWDGCMAKEYVRGSYLPGDEWSPPDDF